MREQDDGGGVGFCWRHGKTDLAAEVGTGRDPGVALLGPRQFGTGASITAWVGI
jgi:hypothetical protein